MSTWLSRGSAPTTPSGRLRPWLSFLLLSSIAGFAFAGCGTLENNASKDPMRCERDPKCDRKRTNSQDCSTQCNDDPACMERCEEVEQGTKLGH